MASLVGHDRRDWHNVDRRWTAISTSRLIDQQGIMYCSMPFLFAAFTNRYMRWRNTCAAIGAGISVASLVLSAFATEVWQLVITQGILQALGSTLLYSSTTIFVDEWFLRRKGFAYGVMLSAKSIVGVGGPLVFGGLLSKVGFANTLLIWAAIITSTAIPSIFLLRPRRTTTLQARRSRQLPWTFLKHRTFWIFQIANVVFSMGYCLPQTYLASFGSKVLHLETANSSLMLAILNVPSIVSNSWFGMLSDGYPYYNGHSVTVSTVTVLSAVGSCLPILLLWGFATPNSAGMVLLTLFAILYGFFAGGYSSTWGGLVKEIEREGSAAHEPVDTGLLFGLLNGGRGIGFVVGGFVGSELLKAGGVGHHDWAYGTNFGSLIIFTGVTAAFGGWGVVWKAVAALLN
jgi:MFS family permease